jgi:uncharacterized membrane protein
MITFLTGWLIVLTHLGHDGVSLRTGLSSAYMTRILTGGLMGTIMWANVWFVIWPAQQVVIANAERVAAKGEPDPTAAARGARAGLVSRTNVLFSIPMLFFMAAATHFNALGAGLATGSGSLGAYWIAALLIVLAVELNCLSGSGKPTQKPLATVSGTIHAGFVLAIVLYALMSILL